MGFLESIGNAFLGKTEKKEEVKTGPTPEQQLASLRRDRDALKAWMEKANAPGDNQRLATIESQIANLESKTQK